MSGRWRSDPATTAFHDGVAAVRGLATQGALSEADADLLLRHLLAAYTARRVTDLVSATLTPERVAQAMGVSRAPAARRRFG